MDKEHCPEVALLLWGQWMNDQPMRSPLNLPKRFVRSLEDARALKCFAGNTGAAVWSRQSLLVLGWTPFATSRNDVWQEIDLPYNKTANIQDFVVSEHMIVVLLDSGLLWVYWSAEWKVVHGEFSGLAYSGFEVSGYCHVWRADSLKSYCIWSFCPISKIAVCKTMLLTTTDSDEEAWYDKITERMHMLLVSRDFKYLYSVGRGLYGQLGHGSMRDLTLNSLGLENDRELLISETPEKKYRVESLLPLPVLDIACGAWHSLCLVSSCLPEPPLAAKRKRSETKESETFFEVYSMGWDLHYQLGRYTRVSQDFDVNDDDVNPCTLPFPILFHEHKDEDIQVLKMDCGSRHSVLLDSEGRIWGSGWNEFGQLGPFYSRKVQGFQTLLCDPNYSHALNVSCGPWTTMVLVLKNDA